MSDKKKLSYWDKRAVNQDITVHKSLDKKENIIVTAYLKGQEYLTKETKKIYNRYVSKTDKTEVEVNRILNTNVTSTELAELQVLAKTIKDKEIKRQVTDYLTGLAVKSRITRLETLKAKSYIVSKQIADVQLKVSTDYYVDVINDAYKQAAVEGIIGKTEEVVAKHNDGKYPTYKMQDGKATLVVSDSANKAIKTIDLHADKPIVEFKELPTKYVKNVLESDWKGSNYSKRIWSDTDLLAKKLEEMFTVEAMTGMSEREMSRELSKQFNVSAGVAKRLVRTEANFVAGQAKLKGWLEHGVEEYKLVVVLDLRTSSICQKKSNENKVYKVKNAVVNGIEGNYPPFHPFCRTVARAHFAGRELRGKRKAYDPIAKRDFTINQSATYKDWEKHVLKNK
ncbi:minor capsid protein [Brochothrix thermosphacta]|uniref:minor capsid protein n=1 Tax=Brochothrix thermosphacta TaxID=2756 RepID=UPI00083F9226|nr:minor capsid protein [Brochothrix thermosphacta]ODJ54801.1 hypothetical protein BFR41_06765 [Brochothrix thermosphacta]